MASTTFYLDLDSCHLPEPDFFNTNKSTNSRKQIDDSCCDDDDDEKPPAARPLSAKIKKVALVIVGDDSESSGKFELAARLAASQEDVKLAVFGRYQQGRKPFAVAAGFRDDDIFEVAVQVVPDNEPIAKFVSSENNREIILFCLSTDTPDPFHKVTTDWLPKLCDTLVLDKPLIVIGTRNNEVVVETPTSSSSASSSSGDSRLVAFGKAENMANWMGAVGYFEWSPKLDHSDPPGLFDLIASAVAMKRRDRRRKSTQRITSFSEGSSSLMLEKRKSKPMTAKIKKIDLVLIGDSGSGKFELGERLASNQDEAKMAIAHYCHHSLKALYRDEDIFELAIQVVPSCEQVAKILESSENAIKDSSQVRIVLFCIAVNMPDSVKRINSHWLPQLCEPVLKDNPLIIVGTKNEPPQKCSSSVSFDSSTNQQKPEPNCDSPTGSVEQKRFVSFEKAQSMSNWIGAVGYLEFSAKTDDGLPDLFEMIAVAASMTRKDRRRKTSRRVTSFVENSSGISTLKMVLVGDGGCGKKSLAKTFSLGQFTEEEYQPAYLEQFASTTYSVAVNKNKILDVPVSLWVTSGRPKDGTIDHYDRVRRVTYPETDVVLLCIAMDDIGARGRLASSWQPEIEVYCPKVPVILVGTKTDLRSDAETRSRLAALSQWPLTRETGEALAKQIGAVAYVECSAKTGENISEVFEVAVKTVLDTDRYQQKNCSLL